jgi:hypothetical protein
VDPFGWIRYGLAATGGDTGAFRDRAEQGAGVANTRTFRSGQDIISTLKSLKDITQLDVHSHGFSGGIIGNGWDTGLYNSSHTGGLGSASLSDLANAIIKGEIDVAKGASLNLFGCNNDSTAKQLSDLLTAGGRSDVLVTGAAGSVSPILPGETSAFTYDSSTGARKTFNTYQGGKLVNTSKTRNYK